MKLARYTKPDYRYSRDSREFLPPSPGAHEEELIDIIERMSTGYWPVIGVDPGWYKLVADLNAKLRIISNEYKVTALENHFGELVYNITVPKTDADKLVKMMPLIAAARKESKITCETCGKPGACDSGRVSCETHKPKPKRRRKEGNDDGRDIS